MSKLRRTHLVAATLAAMNLAGMTAVAQPNDGDTPTLAGGVGELELPTTRSTRVPPAELKA